MDIGEHVGHACVDAHPVQATVNSLTILGEGEEVKGFGGAIPAKVGELGAFVEAVVEGNILVGEVDSCDSRYTNLHHT